MRMAGPDIVLFVIGALLFGGATYAIVSSPSGLGGAGSPLGLFTVTFDEETVELDSQTAPSLRDATLEFEVAAANVSSLEFVIACTGTAGDVGPVAFTLAVQVTGPNGLAGEGTGSCGQGVVVPIEVAPMPESTSAQGSDEAEATANVPEQPSARAAQGTWTVEIAGSRSGAPSPLPINPSDPGGTVTLNAIEWTPRLAPVTR